MQITVPRADIETGIETLMLASCTMRRPLKVRWKPCVPFNRSGIRIGVVSSAVYHPFSRVDAGVLRPQR